ncbi:Cdc6-like AAA superfamily ATPase [Halarchaeum solikamskense]|nr:Cdc6-like AAA superfamily ATPase [Halarchaeum solikamskense]
MRWRELDQLGGTVLIALDEIDAIGGDDGLLVRRGSRSPGVDAALSRT